MGEPETSRVTGHCPRTGSRGSGSFSSRVGQAGLIGSLEAELGFHHWAILGPMPGHSHPGCSGY